MSFEIFKFEIKYRLGRPETYIFFVFLFLFSLAGVDFVFEGVELGPIKLNSPIVIAKTMGAITGFFMILVSMIMGVPVLRDYEHGMESLLFSTPIRKIDYLLGRFAGSFLVLLFIFSGLLWGMLLSENMPWRNPEELLPFALFNYLHPFCTIVLPLLLFGATLFFVSGALSKNMIVVYTQGVFFFVFFILTNAIEHPFIAALLDPFGLGTLSYMTEYWTSSQRMTQLVPLSGALLYNRLFWLLLTMLVATFGFYRFSFSIRKSNKTQRKADKNNAKVIGVETCSAAAGAALQKNYYGLESTAALSSKAKLQQLIQHSLFYFGSILRQVSFWGIVLSGIFIIFINSINLGTVYGVDSYPATYFIVEELQEMSIYFFIIILIFYSGELIWKERAVKFNLIYDALPASDFILLAGKFVGLILIYLVLMLALILAGILFQWTSGYHQIEYAVYASGFLLEILPFLVLYTFISFFFQSLSNNKFVSHLLVIAFFIFTIVFGLLGFDHNLINFGGASLGTYSEMNGYGPFLLPYLWTQAYWLTFCFLLFIAASLLIVRGTETDFRTRWVLAQQRFGPSLKRLTVLALLAFLAIGSFIFYHTNILNEYWSNSNQQQFRATYEQTLKPFEDQPQLSIVAVDLQMELYPERRAYEANGRFVLYNDEADPIKSIPIQKRIDSNTELSELQFSQAAKLDTKYLNFDFYLYELERPLLPGDSLQFYFKQKYSSPVFEAGDPQTDIAGNGTFFKYSEFPSIGYNNKYELSDREQRQEFGLPSKTGMANNEEVSELKKGNSRGDRQPINFNITLGTEADQIAIAPGVLQREWRQNDRRYFHYQVEQPMVNFYSILSARYAVKKDTWQSSDHPADQPIALEIYHHPTHAYNVDRMMEAMENSFDYFNTQFSSYPYAQMRIMEFPRYAAFAQSFPGTIPFSEALGFMLDINDEKDVDMAFFITAHELAHQWWGLQVLAANVQGQNMILESLAQYSALMVFEKRYGAAKTRQLLKMEMEAYFKGRASEKNKELPLAKVENQEYIYYRKGLLNLYALQDYISEEKVNLALRKFINDWNVLDTSTPLKRYATTKDLIKIFRAQTPDSLQYVITDLFEKVIRYDNKTIAASYTKIAEDQFLVDLQLHLQKFNTDSSGVESPIPLNDWIDIGIYVEDANGEQELIYLQKHWVNSAEVSLEIPVNREPSRAGIDPLHVLIDQQPADNVMEFLIRAQ